MSCQPSFNFSIDKHDLTVSLLLPLNFSLVHFLSCASSHQIIETDGEYTDPLTVSSVTVLAGQRYSLVVNASQPVSNYPIRANPNEGNSGFEGGINMAILRYAGAANKDPDWHELANDNPNPLYEHDLHVCVHDIHCEVL